MGKKCTTSCQVAVPTNVWVRFRQACLLEGVCASAKVRQMITEAVLATEPETISNRNVSGELGAKDEEQ